MKSIKLNLILRSYLTNVPFTASVADIAADEFRLTERRLLCGELAEELTGRPSMSSR